MKETTLYPYQNLSLKDLPGEIWKDCPDFEGYLMISNKGRIKDLKRTIYQSTKGGLKTVSYERPERIRKQYPKPLYNKILKKHFYSLIIKITIEKITYSFYVSRKVYEAFCNKITKQDLILHKDWDNFNNKIENLYREGNSELNRITATQGRTNVPEIFASKRKFWPIERRNRLQEKSKTKIKVKQYDLQGNYLNSYPSMREAYKQTGIHETAIRKCILGKQKYAGNYIWKDENDTSDIIAVTPSLSSQPLSCYDKEGNYLAGYYTIWEAEQQTKINRGCIRQCIQGRSRTADGLIWKKGYEPQKVDPVPPISINAKIVSQFDKEGNLIMVYPSISKASKSTGIPEITLGKALRSKPQYIRGFFWMEGNKLTKITPPKRKIRVVYQYDLSGNHIATYPSIVEAGKSMGLSRASISDAVHGRSKTCGGYVWKYVEKII